MTLYDRNQRTLRTARIVVIVASVFAVLVFGAIISTPTPQASQELVGSGKPGRRSGRSSASHEPRLYDIDKVNRTRASTTSAPTKEFSFVAQGGQEVTAITKAIADGSDMHAVVFTPFLEKTDGNLYLASLQSLWNVYGKQRGPFQLQDAQMRANASLGGNAICWRIANPVGEFCIFPTKDSESGRIAALTVWVQ